MKREHDLPRNIHFSDNNNTTADANNLNKLGYHQEKKLILQTTPPSRFISDHVWRNHLSSSLTEQHKYQEEPQEKCPIIPQELPPEPEQVVDDSILFDTNDAVHFYDCYEEAKYKEQSFEFDNGKKSEMFSQKRAMFPISPLQAQGAHSEDDDLYEDNNDIIITPQPADIVDKMNNTELAFSKQLDAIQNQQHVFSQVIR